jgi:hypothetical protein
MELSRCTASAALAVAIILLIMILPKRASTRRAWLRTK